MQNRRDLSLLRRPPQVTPGRTATVTILLLTLVACTGQDTPAEQPTAADAVVQSREALGEPMLALAEAVVDVEEGIDDARHRVQRGEEMLELLDELEGEIDAIADAAEAARQAAAGAEVADAAAVVDQAAVDASDAVPPMREELGFLRDAASIDLALLDAAAAWDRPGSQSEIRARLAEVAREVGRARTRARQLEPIPSSCRAMKQNRRQWSRIVRRRTLNLQSQAHSGGGVQFDRLRAAYRPLPMAEEPRSADRQDRTCWEEHSRVVAAAEQMRTAVDRLRETLSG